MDVKPIIIKEELKPTFLESGSIHSIYGTRVISMHLQEPMCPSLPYTWFLDKGNFDRSLIKFPIILVEQMREGEEFLDPIAYCEITMDQYNFLKKWMRR